MWQNVAHVRYENASFVTKNQNFALNNAMLGRREGSGARGPQQAPGLLRLGEGLGEGHREAREARREEGPRPRLWDASKISNCLQFFDFANFWRACSRLYQNELLQENMRLTAFLKLYKMCTPLHRSKLNVL